MFFHLTVHPFRFIHSLIHSFVIHVFLKFQSQDTLYILLPLHTNRNRLCERLKDQRQKSPLFLLFLCLDGLINRNTTRKREITAGLFRLSTRKISLEECLKSLVPFSLNIYNDLSITVCLCHCLTSDPYKPFKAKSPQVNNHIHNTHTFTHRVEKRSAYSWSVLL